MIDCPSCRHQEFVGTLFCSECGTRLTHISTIPDRSKPREDYDTVGTQPTTPEGPDLESGAFLGLKIVETGVVLSLLGRDTFTLGRSGKKQAVIPDVDLISYDAFEHGVSRIHAEIQLRAEGIYLNDLDSANFTMVNGRQLEPQTPFPVHNGDIIELGGLRLQLISRYRV
jgi:pSer/pThr/pTyr-binding forkhead associated (FHA) protein